MSKFLQIYITCLLWFIAIVASIIPLVISLLMSIFTNCWWIMFMNFCYLFFFPMIILLFRELADDTKEWLL